MGPSWDSLLEISRSFNELDLKTPLDSTLYPGSYDLDDKMGKGMKYNQKRRHRNKIIPNFIPDKSIPPLFHPHDWKINGNSSHSKPSSSLIYENDENLEPKPFKLRPFPSSGDDFLPHTPSTNQKDTKKDLEAIKIKGSNSIFKKVQNFFKWGKTNSTPETCKLSESSIPYKSSCTSGIHNCPTCNLSPQPSFEDNKTKNNTIIPTLSLSKSNKDSNSSNQPSTLLNRIPEFSGREGHLINLTKNQSIFPEQYTFKNISYEHYYHYPPHTLAENANQIIRAFFNLCIVSFLAFILINVYRSVVNDIRNRINFRNRQLSEDILECRNKYLQNHCEVIPRVPVLEISCREFERCMNQDPESSGELSKLSAKLMGEIINTFVEQLNWRTISIIIVIFLFVVIGSNWALSFRPKVPFYTHEYAPHINRHFQPSLLDKTPAIEYKPKIA